MLQRRGIVSSTTMTVTVHRSIRGQRGQSRHQIAHQPERRVRQQVGFVETILTAAIEASRRNHARLDVDQLDPVGRPLADQWRRRLAIDQRNGFGSKRARANRQSQQGRRGRGSGGFPGTMSSSQPHQWRPALTAACKDPQTIAWSINLFGIGDRDRQVAKLGWLRQAWRTAPTPRRLSNSGQAASMPWRQSQGGRAWDHIPPRPWQSNTSVRDSLSVDWRGGGRSGCSALGRDQGSGERIMMKRPGEALRQARTCHT